MKNSLKTLVAAMVIVATTAIVFFGCKKENTDAVLKGEPLVIKAYTPPQVDDMNAYLKDFKQKMQTVTRGEDEMLGLEEAAWHLSSLANYDFCNVNVEFTDLRYDTLYYQVDVNNELVSLVDLNTVYASMSSDIDAFYQGLDLQEKHFRFIGVNVSEVGNVIVSLSTTYIIPKRDLGDMLWYFEDEFQASLFCDEFFNENLSYPLNGFGMTEIERALNLIESHPTEPFNSHRIYYTYIRSEEFYFEDCIDPYGSPFYLNSRLLATKGYFYADMSLEELCYCVDSYAGLGYSHCQPSESPVHWNLEFVQGVMKEQQVGHHFMTVDYGKTNIAQVHIEY